MEDKKIGACVICGTEFVKTRPDRKYCSRICAYAAANRAYEARKKEKLAEKVEGCPYNKELVCSNRNCESCGWNPVVEKRRSERLWK